MLPASLGEAFGRLDSAVFIDDLRRDRFLVDAQGEDEMSPDDEGRALEIGMEWIFEGRPADGFIGDVVLDLGDRVFFQSLGDGFIDPPLNFSLDPVPRDGRCRR